MILYFVWIVTTILLVIFIKRKDLLRAQLSFMFMQVPTWLFGTLVVKGRFIEYPVGFLSVVYKASFTFEYFVFPAISAIFNVHFPREKSWLIKTMYTLSFPSIMTLCEVLLEKYTDLIKYINWSWYLSFITLTITLLLSYWYYLWFCKKTMKMNVEDQ
ncbi:CBO0543 family protein [Paenibacillus sp. LjRoot153]|uniref:CBO0543 family protein n=1 Tax=Paenibacillus sp. LjRoot153 TaxID=3342270 RepID=UPI003F4F5F88